jgi:hypothetical protein
MGLSQKSSSISGIVFTVDGGIEIGCKDDERKVEESVVILERLFGVFGHGSNVIVCEEEELEDEESGKVGETVL